MSVEGDRHRDDGSLKFKAITKGLGFHPFSDGMPYTPQNPETQRTQRVKPRAAAPEIPWAPSVVQDQPAISGAKSLIEAQPAEIVATAPLDVDYLAKRMAAYIFDSLVNIASCGAAFLFVISKLKVPKDTLLNPDTFFLFGLFLLFFSWILVLAQEIAFGTSLGKKLFGLAIQGDALTLFFRGFFFSVSLAMAGLGIFWALFDNKRRCLHDILAKIQPLELPEK